MSTRTRVNDGRFQECGSYYAFGNLQDYACITHGPYESCEDTVGEFETSNRFDLVRIFTHFPTVTGAGEFVGYPIQYHPGPDDPRGAWPAYNLADKNALAWEILAKTNPSVPEVNVPAYLGELKDIPGTMKGWGRSLLRDAAAGYISWQWAVKPLVNDLAKLYNFQRSVDNRMKELYALRDGRTLKRRCSLVRASSRTVTNPICHGIRFILQCQRAVVMRTESWGTAEWKLMPDSKLPTLGYAPLEGLARTSAAGINSYGALEAAWELTPWSWLVDWFSNVDTCIHASNNSLGLTFGRISLMRTSTSESSYVNVSGPIPSQYTLSGWYVEEMTRKERFPVFPVIPVPLPTLPLLTGRQLSILGALAILKGVKP
jgi:hypothetical protein